MADPLTGKLFLSFAPRSDANDDSPREPQYLGQVRSRVRDGLYMVKLVNALTLLLAGYVEFNKQIMVPLDDMRDWEFFDSPDDWRDAYNKHVEQVQQHKAGAR